jgi:predicted PurR-regulated permease PerM
VLYILSFSWFISFERRLIPVYFVAFIVYFILFALDDRFNTRLKYYSIVATVLLVVYTLLSYPLRNWLITQSEKQGEMISKRVEEYKVENGHYPENLNTDYFKDFPKRSFVGPRFNYN